MIILKTAGLILGIFIYIITSAGLRFLLSPIACRFRLRATSNWTRCFNKFLRSVFRIKIIIAGEQERLNENGNFIVSNHLSFLDGVVLGSLFAVIYTSKSQVKNWPLFGLMTQAGGTIFIDRKRKHKSADYISQVANVLKNKINVLVFPEGTSTTGEGLLTFQSVHFQAPLIARCPVLPITLRYTRLNHREIDSRDRDKVCWYGQVSLVAHLIGLLKFNNIEARVVIHPKIELDSPGEDKYIRRQLSESAYKIISADYPIFKK